MPTIELNVNVVMRREGPFWVAQCLPYDVAAQGETPQDAGYEMKRMLAGYALLGLESEIDPLANMPSAAPGFYWDEFSVGTQMIDSGPVSFVSESGAQVVIETKVRDALLSPAHPSSP